MAATTEKELTTLQRFAASLKAGNWDTFQLLRDDPGVSEETTHLIALLLPEEVTKQFFKKMAFEALLAIKPEDLKKPKP
jgi:hypothetical protein